MKKILIITAIAAVCSFQSTAKDKNEKTAIFCTSMDCAHCEKKITENVGFEKGVKDISTNLATKEVKIVYNPEKTDTTKLATAIRKLGYTVTVKK